MKIKLYLEEVYIELTQKVSWPSKAELQNSAMIVMLASAIISLVIFAMDISFKNLMDTIYTVCFTKS